MIRNKKLKSLMKSEIKEEEISPASSHFSPQDKNKNLEEKLVRKNSIPLPPALP